MSEPLKVISSKAGKAYYLHANLRERGGKTFTLHYFSLSPEGAESAIPEGYHVVENLRTGLPFLKKNA